MVDGAILAVVTGLVASALWAWLRKPRVRFLGYTSVNFGSGTLHKVVFQINGGSPGSSCLHIRWPSHRGRAFEEQFAKWDEAANPVDAHSGRFLQWLVPSGYYQPLLPHRLYKVPIVFEGPNGEFEVFSGFWFGRDEGYLKYRALERETVLTLLLAGTGLLWEKATTPEELKHGEPRLDPSIQVRAPGRPRSTAARLCQFLAPSQNRIAAQTTAPSAGDGLSQAPVDQRDDEDPPADTDQGARAHGEASLVSRVGDNEKTNEP
jgi:hypothetical protein